MPPISHAPPRASVRDIVSPIIINHQSREYPCGTRIVEFFEIKNRIHLSVVFGYSLFCKVIEIFFLKFIIYSVNVTWFISYYVANICENVIRNLQIHVEKSFKNISDLLQDMSGIMFNKHVNFRWLIISK